MLVLLAAASACGGEPERGLVVVAPGADPVASRIVAAFEAEHPDVPLHLVVEEGRPSADADVWWGADALALEAARREGALAPLPPGAPPSPREAWLPVERVVPVLAFNTDSIPRSVAPRDVRVLFSVRWRGRVLAPEPAGSALGRALVAWAMDAEWARTGDEAAGLDWLRRLDGSLVAWLPQNDVVPSLAAGRGTVAIADLTDVARARAGGQPVDYVPLEGAVPDLPLGAAALPGADTARAGAFLRTLSGEVARAALRDAYRVPWETDDTPPQWVAQARRRLDVPPLRLDSAGPRLEGWLGRWRTDARGRGERSR